MSKKITSVTIFNDAIGLRMSATYSEINDDTGRIVEDNKRFDRVVTNDEIIQFSKSLFNYANDSLPN